ncbi:MAG: hypothetical protein J5854_04720 [Clostridia bacterium]|nr:hypothetical protein [Clostridia bacterium]
MIDLQLVDIVYGVNGDDERVLQFFRMLSGKCLRSELIAAFLSAKTLNERFSRKNRSTGDL